MKSVGGLPRLASIWWFGSGEPPTSGAAVALWERLTRLLIVIALLIALPISVNRAIQGGGGSDLAGFCKAGTYAFAYGARAPNSNLSRYLPSADVPWAAVALLPTPITASLWYAFGCLSLFGLLHTTARYLLPDASPYTLRTSPLVAGLLVLPLVADGLCLGGFHLVMLWLLVAGLGRISRNRWQSGGLLLGLAVWVKLLPIVGVGYLLLKRRWAPALVAVGCALVIDAVLSVTAYGPQGAWREHVAWWNGEAVGTVDRHIDSDVSPDTDRLTNQSLLVTQRRLLTRLGDVPGSPRGRVAIGNLTGSQLLAVHSVTAGLLALAMAFYLRKPARQVSPARSATEIALVVLSTLWFSPVVWSYHPTAALPALAIILSRGDRHPRLVWSTGLAWIASMILLAWPLARAFGDLFWMSLAVGAVLLWTTPRDLMQHVRQDAAAGH